MLGGRHDHFDASDCCTIVCCGPCMNPAKRDRKIRAAKRYIGAAPTKVVALALLILLIDVYLFLDYFGMLEGSGGGEQQGRYEPGDVLGWRKANDDGLSRPLSSAASAKFSSSGGNSSSRRRRSTRSTSSTHRKSSKSSKSSARAKIGSPPKFEVCECDPNTAPPSVYVECAVGSNGFPAIQIKTDEELVTHPRFTCGLLRGGTLCGCCDCHHEGEATD